MEHIIEKGFFGVFLGLVGSILGGINIAVLIMCILIVMDFITGLMASSVEGNKYSSKKARDGLYKKLAMLGFWLVVVLLETFLRSTGSTIGIVYDIPMPTFLATSYIIGTETLSLFDNYGRMGFNVPKFFVNIGEAIKNAIDKEDKAQ